MQAFDDWMVQFPFYVQIGIYIAVFFTVFFAMRWLMPKRTEIVKRKVKGEGPGSYLRSTFGFVIIAVALMFLFGIHPFTPWWDAQARSAAPPRWVPFVVEPNLNSNPICPKCGERHS